MEFVVVDSSFALTWGCESGGLELIFSMKADGCEKRTRGEAEAW